MSLDEQSEDELTTDPPKPVDRKRRPRQPEIRFEKHYAEPMTEQEQDELADLIAQMIYDGMMRDAGAEPGEHQGLLKSNQPSTRRDNV